jgi:hypothetical protein
MEWCTFRSCKWETDAWPIPTILKVSLPFFRMTLKIYTNHPSNFFKRHHAVLSARSAHKTVEQDMPLYQLGVSYWLVLIVPLQFPSLQGCVMWKYGPPILVYLWEVSKIVSAESIDWMPGLIFWWQRRRLSARHKTSDWDVVSHPLFLNWFNVSLWSTHSETWLNCFSLSLCISVPCLYSGWSIFLIDEIKRRAIIASFASSVYHWLIFNQFIRSF